MTPVDPWSLATDAELDVARNNGREREFALEIGKRNAKAIESSKLLVAYFDGQEVDSGTAAEAGYGAAKGLTCFGLRSDFRQSGENGVAINLQVEYFIVASGGRVCTSLTELTTALADKIGKSSGGLGAGSATPPAAVGTS